MQTRPTVADARRPMPPLVRSSLRIDLEPQTCIGEWEMSAMHLPGHSTSVSFLNTFCYLTLLCRNARRVTSAGKT